MITLTPCEKTGLQRIAYGKDFYVNTEDKLIRVKAAIVWLDNENKEWRREEKIFVITDNDIVGYEDTGEIDEDGNPIQKPIGGYTKWYSTKVDADSIGEALKTAIENYLSEHIQ